MTDHAQDDAGEADYRGAGYTGALEPGSRPALVIVDPVRAYTDPSCGLYAGVEEAVGQMRVVLAAARRAGIPVYITSVSFTADGSNGGVFFRKVPALAAFLPGSPYARFIDGLDPRDSETLIVKQYPSAFFGTSLAADLVARGVDTVLVAGLSTSGCVRATALDALQHGFVPLVVEDAVGDRLASVHEANLFDIGKKIGEVWHSREVLAYLERVVAPPAPFP